MFFQELVSLMRCFGIPYEMLTDQGSVFMGKLTKELCGLLKSITFEHSRTICKWMGGWNAGMVP